MNIYLETLRYYADWIGIPVVKLEQATEKVIYVENPDRANTPAGYSNPVDIYIFASEKAVFVSYSGKSKQIVENMQANCKCYNDINILSEEMFRGRAVRKIKYYLDEPPKALSFTAARALTYGDFPQYLKFFKNNNPQCIETDWLYDYFKELVDCNLIFGVFSDGRLVSVADSPSVPYRQGKVAEIGVNTLYEYRRKGFARQVCAAMLNSLTERGIVPLWSHEASNAASRKLAESIGFKSLAEVIEITM